MLDHPLLELGVLEATLPGPVGALETPPRWTAALSPDADLGLTPDGAKDPVRALLRHGGFKPAGRNKPASEYLASAAAKDGRVRSINVAVDACNVVSLHCGLPISVVDLDLLTPPLRVEVAAPDAEYVFNPSGQVLKLGGLLVLRDAHGPCANGVKDSQRTKTHPDTTRTLSLIWGTKALPGRTQRALDVYATLLREVGAEVEVALLP